MRFKTRRQNRYVKLGQYGFLPFEAQPLSKVAWSVPYMRLMIKDRIKLLKRAKSEEWSKAQYKADIIGQYQRKGWRKRGKPELTVADPWAMLRDFADRYKVEHPEYESPWVKKQKQYRNFSSKFDRGLEKYDRGRYR